jgi:Flp pilus assembly protein CpaB
MDKLSALLAQLPFKSGQLLIGMAVVMAILSGLVFKTMVSSKPSDAPTKAPVIETQAVVVSTASLPVGKVLTTDDLKVVDWPKTLLPQGSIANDPSKLLGRMVLHDLLPGDVVYGEKLSGPNSTGGLPVLLPHGMRAISVGASEVKEVAGFVRPGDYVDVLGTFEDTVPDPTGSSTKTVKFTRTVLQHVLVVAIAQDMVKQAVQPMVKQDVPTLKPADGASKDGPNPDSPDPKKEEPKPEEAKPEEAKEDKKDDKKDEAAKLVTSVTLALNPADAQKLALAEDTGSIRLVLRGALDVTQSPVAGVNTAELLTGDYSRQGKWPFKATTASKPAPKADPLPTMVTLPPLKPPPMATVELIEGGQKRMLAF